MWEFEYFYSKGKEELWERTQVEINPMQYKVLIVPIS